MIDILPARRRSRSLPAVVATFVLLGAMTYARPAAAAPETTTWASVSSAEVVGNDESLDPHVSADGRLVVFESEATNLVPGDTNSKLDIFVRNLVEGTTGLVSVSAAGEPANGDSGVDPIISADGRFVAFPSKASNLVANDANGTTQDLFLRDLEQKRTTLVSVSTAGVQGNRASFDPYVSGDGRYVIFSSQATNLVPGDTNGKTDVFRRDVVAGVTIRVSVATGGTQSNGNSEDAVVSDDGRIVAFSSLATNLVTGDTNTKRDTFVRDVQAGTTRRVSVSSAGAQANGDSGYNPAISGNGRFVAFNDDASNLVPEDRSGRRHVYVHDRVTAATTLVSVSSAGVAQNRSSTSAPSLSNDGRYVAFLSSASNLVPGDTNSDRDVFLRDRVSGTTRRMSVTASGAQATGGDCFSQPYVSGSGNVVVYTCEADDLMPGDDNDAFDVFVRILTPPRPPDGTAPVVTVQSPAAGATVSGIVDVAAGASDDTGVARVEFSVNGVVVQADTTAPYSYAWDTVGVPNGTYALGAQAVDAAGNRGLATPVSVTVDNVPDTTPPAVAIEAPAGASTVVGKVDVTALATDGIGVRKVEFRRDGLLLAADTAAPWSVSWDTTTVPNGSHTLLAEAWDRAGNRTVSAPVTVTVANPPPASVTLHVTAAADTFVRADRPGTSYGAAEDLEVDGDPLKRTLLRFDVGSLGGRSVTSARLRLWVTDAGKGGEVRSVSSSWNESSVTWNTQPAPGTQPGPAIGAVEDDLWCEVDITSLIPAAGGVASVVIMSGSSSGVDYASRDVPGLGPQLVVNAQ